MNCGIHTRKDRGLARAEAARLVMEQLTTVTG